MSWLAVVVALGALLWRKTSVSMAAGGAAPMLLTHVLHERGTPAKTLTLLNGEALNATALGHNYDVSALVKYIRKEQGQAAINELYDAAGGDKKTYVLLLANRAAKLSLRLKPGEPHADELRHATAHAILRGQGISSTGYHVSAIKNTIHKHEPTVEGYQARRAAATKTIQANRSRIAKAAGEVGRSGTPVRKGRPKGIAEGGPRSTPRQMRRARRAQAARQPATSRSAAAPTGTRRTRGPDRHPGKRPSRAAPKPSKPKGYQPTGRRVGRPKGSAEPTGSRRRATKAERAAGISYKKPRKSRSKKRP